MTETINSTPLLGMTLAELRNVAETCGMPRFAAKQMLDWIYKKGVMSTSEMTNLQQNLARKTRGELCDRCQRVCRCAGLPRRNEKVPVSRIVRRTC